MISSAPVRLCKDDEAMIIRALFKTLRLYYCIDSSKWLCNVGYHITSILDIGEKDTE
jgi:hypothetical protein